MNTIEKLDNEQIAKLTSKRTLPEFSPGDTPGELAAKTMLASRAL